MNGEDKETYSGQLLSSDSVDSLGEAGGLIDLAAVDETRASQEDAGLAGLGLVQGVELGVGNGLGNILLGNSARGNALENLDGLLGALADGGGRARELNSQETGVRVGEVGGRDGETGSAGGGLGEEAEARGPFDAGLAAEKGGKDGNLGLGRVVAGAGESNDDGVASSVARSLLTTEVLAGIGLQGLAASRGSGHVLEELADPLGEGIGSGAIGDDSDVGPGVDNVGEAGNVILVQVLLEGSRGSRVQGGTQTRVEGDGVGVVEGDSGDIGIESDLLEAENALNLLVEFVGWQ